MNSPRTGRRGSSRASDSSGQFDDAHGSDAIRRVVEALQRAGCEPRKGARGWQARCPGHDDRRPSLSLAEGCDGRVLLRCMTGCDTERVLGALDLEWRDLFSRSSRGAR